ncbi:Cell division control protein 25 [Yarrowia sp. C11]|nr:Cell division control protein 25 [Yarrowia sp. C11]
MTTPTLSRLSTIDKRKDEPVHITMTSAPSHFAPQPQAIGTVVALYDFHSDRPHSLPFKKGDTIQVLLKLDSGWWDGVHSGTSKRGWFPSNYTRLIDTPQPSSPKKEPKLDTTRDLRSSLSAFSMSQDRQSSASPRRPASSSVGSSIPDEQGPPTARDTPRDPRDTISRDPLSRDSLQALNHQNVLGNLSPAHTRSGTSTPASDYEVGMANSVTGQRKGSVVSYSSTSGRSLSPVIDSLDSTQSTGSVSINSLDPVQGVLVTELPEASPANPASYWIPQTSACGQLYWTEPVSGMYMTTLPFQKVSDPSDPGPTELTVAVPRVMAPPRQVVESARALETVSDSVPVPAPRLDSTESAASASEANLVRLRAIEGYELVFPGTWETLEQLMDTFIEEQTFDALCSILALLHICSDKALNMLFRRLQTSVGQRTIGMFASDGEGPTEADAEEILRLQEQLSEFLTEIRIIAGNMDLETFIKPFGASIETQPPSAQSQAAKDSQILGLLHQKRGMILSLLTQLSQQPHGEMDDSVVLLRAVKQALVNTTESVFAVLESIDLGAMAKTNNKHVLIDFLEYKQQLYENLSTGSYSKIPHTMDQAISATLALQEEREALHNFSSRMMTEPSATTMVDGSPAMGHSAPPPSTYSRQSSTRSASSLPWFIQAEYDSGLILDDKGNVRAGSIIALVERLTHHDSLDSSFNSTMLLTFRTFMTPHMLLELLIQRFTIQPPEGLTAEEFDLWESKKQRPIRIRVYNILKNWLEHNWLEPVSPVTHDLLAQIETFVLQMVSQNFPGAKQLLTSIQMRQKGEEIKKRMVQNPAPTPPPIISRNFKRQKLQDLDSVELCRQLTIRESRLFCAISPIECLNKEWNSKRGTSGAGEPSNIRKFIQNSNCLTNWVAACILAEKDTKKRAAVIKYFVQVSEQCRQINNFSSMTAIISALYSSTIHRLKKSWELVSARTMASLENMNKLMNSTRNFNEYRDMLHLVNPPIIPFFGVYLTDLTFVADGNPDFIKGEPKLINFSKRTKTADIVREIQQYQSIPYSFQELPEVQQRVAARFKEAPSIDDQYETSLALEPRDKQPSNDKMAKILQENGFL